MSEELLIKNGEIFKDNKLRELDILIKKDRIVDIKKKINPNKIKNKIDAKGKKILPGGIDIHVHFREPGETYKEDWKTGSLSAAHGGITTVVDQPNTSPPTIDGSSFDLKKELAEKKSLVDFGINAGVTRQWKPQELKKRKVTAYGEIFMANSTGKMGISIELLKQALKKIEDTPITIHAEHPKIVKGRHRPPKAEIKAVKEAIEIAKSTEVKLHFAHISHPRSVEILNKSKHTCEVTPHHLFLSKENVDKEFRNVNPPLRKKEAQEKLLKYFKKDKIDAVASDHAPHTIKEKKEGACGFPGVETLLPLLLSKVSEGNLELSKVVKTACFNPSKILNINSKGNIKIGKDADLLIVDFKKEKIRSKDLNSKCTWSPFEGFNGIFPEIVIRRGEIIYRKNELKDKGGKFIS